VAHARIKSIDTSKAWQIPGVRLVLTGEMAAQRNLAWMPTLSYDTQAVLASRSRPGQECLRRVDDRRQRLVLHDNASQPSSRCTGRRPPRRRPPA